MRMMEITPTVMNLVVIPLPIEYLYRTETFKKKGNCVQCQKVKAEDGQGCGT